MEVWLGMTVCIMAAAAAVLLVKIHLLQKSAEEIRCAFADRLQTDTNTLIDISGRDRHMRKLAAGINEQLATLRGQRHRFQQGDLELKNAITNISHDLRTPLTAMISYLELLEEEEMSPAVSRYVEVVRGRAEELKRLTEELFAYSVIINPSKVLKREEVALGQVLEESVAEFYAALKERQISPIISLPEEKVFRRLDGGALSRIFDNLLSNALKYSDGDLEIVLSPGGLVTFSNSARNLNEVQLGKLFDRFYTVEGGRGSTGLGLSIARTLVEEMEGNMAASYEDGRLRIWVWFPE